MTTINQQLRIHNSCIVYNLHMKKTLQSQMYWILEFTTADEQYNSNYGSVHIT